MDNFDDIMYAFFITNATAQKLCSNLGDSVKNAGFYSAFENMNFNFDKSANESYLRSV